MISESLGLDDKDISILSWFMESPEISQNEIAERLKLSQPSVNVRIQKLKKKGILNHNVGINFNTSNLILTRVDFTSSDANRTMDGLKRCTFFVNGFIISGKNNASAFFVHDSIRKIEDIINEHLRKDPEVSDITVNVVVSSAKDFIFNLDLTHESKYDSCRKIGDGCKTCSKILSEHNEIQKGKKTAKASKKR